MYVTIDGGLTWESKASPKFVDMSFADENTGLGISFMNYVTLEQGLYKTEDGGDNWTLFSCLSSEFGATERTGSCVSYLSPDNAWIGGYHYDAVNNVNIHGLYHYQGE